MSGPSLGVSPLQMPGYPATGVPLPTLSEDLPLLAPWVDFRPISGDTKKGKWNVGKRAPLDIKGIVLHNTGHHGQRSAQGWLDQIGVNFFIPANGVIHYCFDVLEQRDGVAGHAAIGKQCVGVEFIGNFKNARGKFREKGVHKGHRDTPTRLQILAGRRLIRFLKFHYRITKVYAHRHTDGNRRGNDPGPEIWYNVGQWAIERLGLVNGGPSKNAKSHSLPGGWEDEDNLLVPFGEMG